MTYKRHFFLFDNDFLVPKKMREVGLELKNYKILDYSRYPLDRPLIVSGAFSLLRDGGSKL